MTAFTSLMWLLKLVVTKCALSFPCFPPSLELRPWHRHYSQEHTGKTAHWAFKRANDLIYKGAFKQRSNLDWLYSIFSISLWGHIVPYLISRETEKIKDKSLETQTGQETLDFGGSLVWDGPSGDHGVRDSMLWGWRGGKLVREVIQLSFLFIPRAWSLHHPNPSDVLSRQEHTTAPWGYFYSSNWCYGGNHQFTEPSGSLAFPQLKVTTNSSWAGCLGDLLLQGLLLPLSGQPPTLMQAYPCSPGPTSTFPQNHIFQEKWNRGTQHILLPSFLLLALYANEVSRIKKEASSAKIWQQMMCGNILSSTIHIHAF